MSHLRFENNFAGPQGTVETLSEPRGSLIFEFVGLWDINCACQNDAIYGKCEKGRKKK